MDRHESCVFCDIVAGETRAEVVFEDDLSVAFLDFRPLFHGHTLLVPRAHIETILDLPEADTAAFFSNVRLLAGAIQTALDAHGSFLAVNNKVSQSVPHLHVHIVPRRFKDGLKGFFWPRRKYKTAAEMAEVADAIRAEIRS